MATYIDLGPCVTGNVFSSEYDKVCFSEFGDMSLAEYKGMLNMMVDGYSYSIYQHNSINVVMLAEFMQFHFDRFVLRHPHKLTKSQYNALFGSFFKQRHSVIQDLVMGKRNKIKNLKQGKESKLKI